MSIKSQTAMQLRHISNFTFFLLLFFFFACQESNSSQEESSSSTATLAGNYASQGYEQRAEGYDWVGVRIKPLTDSTAKIEVRSRADKKDPTCYLNITGKMTAPNTLEAHEAGVIFDLILQDEELTIAPSPQSARSDLSYYCSGGGTLAGTYQRIDGPLDSEQVDPAAFKKFLNWDKYHFDVVQIGEEVTITPYGFEISNEPQIHPIEGEVTGAEVGDLNIDGFPELMVYVQKPGPYRQGTVLGYSSNNGKSMSMVNLPALENTPGAAEGYLGYDEFAIVETILGRRFPIYTGEGENAQPTGETRQLQYKLEEGEAMRQLVVDRMIEY